MKVKLQNLAFATVFCFGMLAQAKTIRATEMSSDSWSKMTEGVISELIVEFHQGDELPVTLSSEGDFLETSQAGTSYVLVKRDFWLKVIGNDVQMSSNGHLYRPISDVITGHFSSSAGSGSSQTPANAINLVHCKVNFLYHYIV